MTDRRSCPPSSPTTPARPGPGAGQSGAPSSRWLCSTIQVALLNKASYGHFTLRLQDLHERQRAARDLGYRYSYRILASAAIVLLAVVLQPPEDRLLGATNRLTWLAVAIVVVQLMWMLPTMIVGWIEPVRAWTDKSAPVTLRPPVTAVVTLPQAGCSSVASAVSGVAPPAKSLPGTTWPGAPGLAGSGSAPPTKSVPIGLASSGMRLVKRADSGMPCHSILSMGESGWGGVCAQTCRSGYGSAASTS